MAIRLPILPIDFQHAVVRGRLPEPYANDWEVHAHVHIERGKDWEEPRSSRGQTQFVVDTGAQRSRLGRAAVEQLKITESELGLSPRKDESISADSGTEKVFLVRARLLLPHRRPFPLLDIIWWSEFLMDFEIPERCFLRPEEAVTESLLGWDVMHFLLYNGRVHSRGRPGEGFRAKPIVVSIRPNVVVRWGRRIRRKDCPHDITPGSVEDRYVSYLRGITSQQDQRPSGPS